MRRRVAVDPWTFRTARNLAATMKDGSPGDVLDVSLMHEVEMMATIHRAGLGGGALPATDVLALYAQAVNLLAARAANAKGYRA